MDINATGNTASAKQASTWQGVLLTVAAVMPAMAIISIVPVLPALMREFSGVAGHEFLVPIAATIPAVCLALFSPLAGWLADRMGRKPLLVWALFLYGLMGGLPIFLTDLKQIIAARFVLGITEAAIMTCATTLIGDYFEGKRREKWIGLQVATVSIAAIVLVMLGGILGEVLGSRGPFLLYTVALPLAFACWFILYEPIRRGRANESAEPTPVPVGDLWPLMIGGLVLGILFYVAIVKLGEMLAFVAEVSPSLVGQVGALTNMGVVAGALLFGLLKSRTSGPALLIIGAACMAIGYGLVPSATSVAQLTIGCALACLGSGLLMPTMITWTMNKLVLEVRGRGVGLFQGMFFFGQFVSPITAVALTQALGSLQDALYVYVAVAIGMLLVAALNLRGRGPLSAPAAA